MEKRSWLVYSLILQAIQDNVLMEMLMSVKTGDGRGVWSMLVNRFERQSVASQASLYDRLLKIRMENGEDIDAYSARLKNICRALAAGNEPVPEPMQKHILTNGLPDSYNPLVEALGLQSNLTYDQMVMHLIDHQQKERLKEQMDGHGANIESANFVGQRRPPPARPFGNNYSHQRSFGTGNGYRGANHQGGSPMRLMNNGGGTGGNGSRQCWTCGKTDHINRNCPTKKCFNCGGRGHLSMNCRGGNGMGGSQYQGQSTGFGASAMSAVTGSANQQGGNGGRFNSGAGVVSHFETDDGEVAWMATSITNTSGCGTCKIGPDDWVFDSGASRHLTNNKSILTDIRPLIPPVPLETANKNIIMLRECGTASLTLLNGKKVTLNNVAYHEGLASNLLSVGIIADAGYGTFMGQHEARVYNQRGEVILSAPRKGTNLYVLRKPKINKPVCASGLDATSSPDAVYHVQSPVSTSVPTAVITSSTVPTTPEQLWHNRFGHIGMSSLEKLSRADAVKGMGPLNIPVRTGKDLSIDRPEQVCPGCVIGKSTRLPFADHMDPSHAANEKLERVHADLRGPITFDAPTTAQQVTYSPVVGKGRYILQMVDEKTRMGFLKVIHAKSDAASEIRAWILRVERETGQKVKEFHTDGGGEFASLKSFFASKGIVHSVTQKYTPQHNGIVERRNRTVGEKAMSMLHAARLPKVMWPYAVETANYLINRSLTTGTTQQKQRPEYMQQQQVQKRRLTSESQ